jgi:hypothetical protein
MRQRPKRDVAQEITNLIIATIEAGTLPWRRPWKKTGMGGAPLRAAGVPYTGIMLGKPGQGAWAPQFEGNVLAIAEGMEDAASYAQIRGIPCWAALGNERLALIEVPEHVGKLYIAEDNDGPGRCAAMTAAEVHKMPRRQIIRDAPPSNCHDWTEVGNDMASPTA